VSSEVVDERFYALGQLLGCHRAGNKRGTGGGPGGCSPSGLAGAEHLISADEETVCSFRHLDVAGDREALRAGGVARPAAPPRRMELAARFQLAPHLAAVCLMQF
jgi:hypothetical protein